MPARLRRCALFVVVAVATSMLGACDGTQPGSPAGPTVPGVVPIPPIPGPPSTGPIAFVSDRDGAKAIYLANADGTGVTRLTAGEQPAWAPGGGRLAFFRSGGIHVINANGSAEVRVAEGSQPTWSPDGTRIAFVDGPSEFRGGIFVMNASGSDVRLLISHEFWNTPGGPDYGAHWPSWSPDGQSIAFIRASYDARWSLYVVNVNGPAAPRRLVDGTSGGTAWSPDGSRIAFGQSPGLIGIVGADGGWSGSASGYEADWTPDGNLIVSRFAGVPVSSNRAGSRMRIFLGSSPSPLLPEAAAPALPSYWDYQPVWAR